MKRLILLLFCINCITISGYGMVPDDDDTFPYYLIQCDNLPTEYIAVNSNTSVDVRAWNLSDYPVNATLIFKVKDISNSWYIIDQETINIDATNHTDITMTGLLPNQMYSGYTDCQIDMIINNTVKDSVYFSDQFISYFFKENWNGISSLWSLPDHGLSDVCLNELKFGKSPLNVSTTIGKLIIDIPSQLVQVNNRIRGGGVQFNQPAVKSGDAGNYGYYSTSVYVNIDHDYANFNFWLYNLKTPQSAITMECFKAGSTTKIYCVAFNQYVEKENNNKTEVYFYVDNLNSGYHTLGIEWMPDHISWYVDGVKKFTLTNTQYIPNEILYPKIDFWMSPKAWWDSSLPNGCDLEYYGEPVLEMYCDWVAW